MSIDHKPSLPVER
jgi:serine/threonine protein phosphatase PrpC